MSTPVGTPHVGGQASEQAAVLRPYEVIHEHAELELELVGRGETERLAELAERWVQMTRDLPAHPPAAAAPLLRRTRLINERTRIELVRLRESLLAEIGTSARARRAADGYAGQLPHRSRLDRRA